MKSHDELVDEIIEKLEGINYQICFIGLNSQAHLVKFDNKNNALNCIKDDNGVPYIETECGNVIQAYHIRSRPDYEYCEVMCDKCNDLLIENTEYYNHQYFKPEKVWINNNGNYIPE